MSSKCIVDVNECQVNNGGCAHMCNNTDGSFLCSCEAGYTLAFNNVHCDGIVNDYFVSAI